MKETPKAPSDSSSASPAVIAGLDDDLDESLPPRGPPAQARPNLGGMPATPPLSAQAPSAAAMSGVRKAAVLVLSLEEEVASLLLRFLSDEDLSRITNEIASLGVVEKECVSEVIKEFRELEQLHGFVREGGTDQAVRLIERSLPREKAQKMLRILGTRRPTAPFAFLDGVEIETLMAFLEEEHPQTLAVICANMTPSKAGEVLQRLPPENRREIIQRIATLEGTSAQALDQVGLVLEKHLDAARFESLGEAGGVKAVAEILRASGGEGTAFLDDIRQDKPELADQIGKHFFVFDDIVRLDDRAVQSVLKEIEVRTLALALKNAGEGIKAKVLGNLPRRTGDMVREQMDFLGPIRFSEIEAAREEIRQVILGMEKAGQLFISGRGREENRIVY